MPTLRCSYCHNSFCEVLNNSNNIYFAFLIVTSFNVSYLSIPKQTNVTNVYVFRKRFYNRNETIIKPCYIQKPIVAQNPSINIPNKCIKSTVKYITFTDGFNIRTVKIRETEIRSVRQMRCLK